MSVAAYFSPKIRLGVEGRKGLKARLQHFKDGLPAHKPIALFHAASLGEFEQGRPVIEAFKAQYPGYSIVLTFFSPSGYEIRKNYSGADFICYLPLDTPANSRWFVEILKPRIAFFIKYEFWYNILQNLEQNGTLILSFSTIFRPHQLFFKSYASFYREMLNKFDFIFVQNEESMSLLASIEHPSYGLAGDTRFDRVYSIALQAQPIASIEPFVTDLPILIAGSVWSQDMEVLITVLNQKKGRMKAIIAPHEIKPDQIQKWCEALDGKSIRYSQLPEGSLAQSDFLFIDNIGMLSSLYQYGQMAYIGGSFGAGLHNTLEAATFGLPLVFGNRAYHRFKEAIDLIGLGGAQTVSNSKELDGVIENWLANEAARQGASRTNSAYILDNLGATETIMNRVDSFLLSRYGPK